ncbi:hypothetical protein ZIOFF_020992 [Zingiber officinale]|uniref:Uncharacterized protein n=1 Tax=Zingiber officinale TaxID=94328 RepID=A0A8J5HJC1_ZINOF|nr:hypothetical protein ZIOFF_020992 [Zingiber officinale]
MRLRRNPVACPTLPESPGIKLDRHWNGVVVGITCLRLRKRRNSIAFPTWPRPYWIATGIKMWPESMSQSPTGSPFPWAIVWVGPGGRDHAG